MNSWERFAESDPFFYICTDPRDRERFFESGRELTERSIARVEDLLPGRGLAIEIGSGLGRLTFPHAEVFETVRAVDIAPTMLRGLRALAADRGLSNIHTYLPDEPWDEPGGIADYVYSYLVFQHIDDLGAIVTFFSRLAGALRPLGIAQLQFDTRPRTLPYRLRGLTPEFILPRTQRRGIRRTRRSPDLVRRLILEVGLSILDDFGAGTEEHWFILQRAGANGPA